MVYDTRGSGVYKLPQPLTKSQKWDENFSRFGF